MVPRLNDIYLFVGILTCITVCTALPADVNAQRPPRQAAGLRFKTVQVDPQVLDSLRAEIRDVFESVEPWAFLDFKATRTTLASATRDCFTDACLTQAGSATGAEVGVSIDLSGEAEIYEWTIAVWDLQSGQKLGTQKDTCELCGHTEVRRTFGESLKSALNAFARSGGRAHAGKQPATSKPSATNQVPLRVSVVPEDATIFIDDQRAGQGRINRGIGTGAHEVRFQREGYGGFVETIVVEPGTDGPVVLSAHLSRTDPEAVEVPTGVGPIDRLGDTRDTYGWLATGTGAVLLGGGIWLTAIDGQTSCGDSVPTAQCPDVYATGAAGLTMGAVGAALITGGVTLLSWDDLAGDTDGDAAPADDRQPDTDQPGEPTAPQPAVSLSPAVGPSGASVLLRGTF